MTEWTTSFFVSGFLPTDSATLLPKIPIPIPIPKNANPNIVPMALIVADNILSILTPPNDSYTLYITVNQPLPHCNLC